jgi:hypothetical protein
MRTRHRLVEYHGDNRATLECPAGHQYRTAVIPKKRGLPPPGETAVRLLVSWWKKTGVITECQKCRR